MGRQVPFGQIKPPDAVLPSCKVVVEGKHFELNVHTSTGKLSYTARAEVVEASADGQDLIGMTVYEQWVIGMEDDLECEQPETYLNPKNFGARRLEAMGEASGIANDGPVDEEELPAKYPGVRYGVAVQYSVEPQLIAKGPQAGQPNPYAGRERNNINRYFVPGEEELMVLAATPGTAVVGKPKAVAAKPKATPLVQHETASAKPPTAGKPAATKPKADAGEKEVPCVVCNEKVKLSAFQKHVEEKHPD